MLPSRPVVHLVAVDPCRQKSAMASCQEILWHQPSARCASLQSYTGGCPASNRPCTPTTCSTLAMSSSRPLADQARPNLTAQSLVRSKQMPFGLCHPTSQAYLPSTTPRQPCLLTSSLGHKQVIPGADQMGTRDGNLKAVWCHTSLTKRPKQDQAETRVRMLETNLMCSLLSYPISSKSVWPHFWSSPWLVLHQQSLQASSWYALMFMYVCASSSTLSQALHASQLQLPIVMS